VVLEGEREAAMCFYEWVVDPQLRGGQRVQLRHEGRRLGRGDVGPTIIGYPKLVVGIGSWSGCCLHHAFGCGDGACDI